MKSFVKTLLLIFLCFFTTAVFLIAVCVTPNFASRELHAFACSALQVVPLGDPVATPGGGG